jgi:membrane glycosyltransferase
MASGKSAGAVQCDRDLAVPAENSERAADLHAWRAAVWRRCMRLFFSMLIEMVFSMLLAPVRMLFHTHFVVAAFMGWALRWKSPAREDSETTPGEAFRHHGFHTLVGLVWGGGIFWLNPTFLPWLLPIVGSLVVAIPVSVYSSKVSHGVRFRLKKLFVIPEEATAPVELMATVNHLNTKSASRSFVDAVTDPLLNGVMCATGKLHTSRSPAANHLREKNDRGLVAERADRRAGCAKKCAAGRSDFSVAFAFRCVDVDASKWCVAEGDWHQAT